MNQPVPQPAPHDTPATTDTDTDTDTDILIIGAGPVGLVLACDLARRAIPFRLLERNAAPSNASRAKTIQPRTMEVADDLGVAERVLAQGATNVPTRRYDRDRVLGEAVELAGGHPTPDAPYPPVWLSQPKFEQILRDRLAELGGAIEWATELTGLRQDAGAVTATVTTPAGPGTVRARYAVGADGGRSTVRTLAGIRLHGTSHPDQRWHLGDIRLTGLPRHCQHLWTGPEDGLLSLFPLPGTDLWQFQASIPADQARPEEPSLDLFRRILADRTGLPGIDIQQAEWLSLYKVNVLLADRYRTGRVLLAGDTAHIHSPAGGQGMNTGVQDAHNLGWKLAAVLDGADDALLDTYDSERRPIARHVLEDTTQRLNAVMRAAARTPATPAQTPAQTPGPAAPQGRPRHGQEAAPAPVRDDRVSAQQGLTDDHTTGLHIAYPDSPLTHGTGAGHRAPDAPCTDAATGRTTRLLDLMRGPHWTLLTFGDTTLTDPPTGLHTHRITTDPTATGPDTLVDTHHHAHDAYHTTGNEHFLIRPDGYTAARLPADQLATALALFHAHGL